VERQLGCTVRAGRQEKWAETTHLKAGWGKEKKKKEEGWASCRESAQDKIFNFLKISLFSWFE
jgi:hypothetical protein